MRGIVQGVGFRPFVYRLARELALDGWVRNDGAGVTIEVQGDAARIDRLRARLRDDAPPLARVDSVARHAMRAERRIAASPSCESGGGRAATAIGPDSAVCADCLRELFDAGRPPLPLRVHQLHALRSALHDHARLPYDRATTSMAAFAQCPALPRRIPRARATAASTPSRMPARRADRGSRCSTRAGKRVRGADPIAATLARAARAARSSRSRASAASISPAMRATPARSRACARASRARKSRSR